MMEIMIPPLLDRFGTTSQKIMMETMIPPLLDRFGTTSQKIMMDTMMLLVRYTEQS